MSKRPYQVCTCCVMDTSDEDITFDENGVCMRCKEYQERILPEWNYGKGHEAELHTLLDAIKKSGEGKPYDCILGLSGGLDSSYMLHLAVTEWGLRPFVFHIDCGWNLPVAEENIKRLTNKLGVKLHVEKMDWNELREMQLAWFRTGLESLDAPQDHAFIALIDRFSRELGVKYILNGYNIATEVIADPASWNKGAGPTGDSTYMKDVIRKLCSIPIRHYTFTNGFKHKLYLPYVLGVKTVKPLNLVPFTRAEMIVTLSREYGYEPYGQKHFEDLITKFLEGMLGLQIGSIYGFKGILIVQSLKFFPLVFIYMNGAFKNIDNTLMEASANMGCIGVRRLFNVVLALSMPTILAAALMGTERRYRPR